MMLVLKLDPGSKPGGFRTDGGRVGLGVASPVTSTKVLPPTRPGRKAEELPGRKAPPPRGLVRWGRFGFLFY
ncbi:unnamed protein product [Boreogadus saida]